ncbi:hypothetical protein PoMZ_04033 [Pyricularia oryzae]|uniref:Uncharacterized protein n=1 Tax=Pyricularia oryzae TaxID=318829 RepID=A0A4P7N988_PYROR|nr:hypothetical protein PoMZ_04033 [Pyricularia oryzae]
MSRMSVVGGASASQENRHTNRESFSSKCDEKVLAAIEHWIDMSSLIGTQVASSTLAPVEVRAQGPLCSATECRPTSIWACWDLAV